MKNARLALALLAVLASPVLADGDAVFLKAVLDGTRQSEASIKKVFYSDDGRQITNSSAAPYRMIGRLYLNGRQICTAFLVGDEVAMTARHCTRVPQDKDHAYSFHYDGGGPWRDSSRHQWDELDVVKIVRAVDGPLIASTDADGKPIYPEDWAVLKLSCPHPESNGCPDPKAWGHLNIAADVRVGQPTISVGFPDPFAHYKSTNPRCSVRKLFQDTIYSDCSLDKGDSGGPLLTQNAAGEWEVVGVFSNIGTLPDGQPPMGEPYSDAIANHYTNVTLYRARLLALIRALELPTP